MNKKLKYMLQIGFEAPQPQKKEEFLKKWNDPKSTYPEFFVRQFRYIGIKVWCSSIAISIIVIGIVFLSKHTSANLDEYPIIWMSGALLPFLACLTINSLYRSASFDMAELELTCRHDLPHIVLARAVILGISNFLLLLILVFTVGILAEMSFLYVGFYFFVPYFLTCAVLMFTLSYINGKEKRYYCGFISVFISSLFLILSQTQRVLFSEQSIWAWGILCIGSFLLFLMQIGKFIKTIGGVKWNFI